MRTSYGLSSIWRLDEYDRMIDSIVATAPELLARPEKEMPEVLRPDLLSWEREREMLWEQIDSDLVSRTSEKDVLVEASVEEFVAYAALRDFMRTADRNEDVDSFEAGRLMMELRRIVADPDSSWQPFDTAAAVFEEFVAHRNSQLHPDDAASLGEMTF